MPTAYQNTGSKPLSQTEIPLILNRDDNGQEAGSKSTSKELRDVDSNKPSDAVSLADTKTKPDCRQTQPVQGGIDLGRISGQMASQSKRQASHIELHSQRHIAVSSCRCASSSDGRSRNASGPEGKPLAHICVVHSPGSVTTMYYGEGNFPVLHRGLVLLSVVGVASALWFATSRRYWP